MRVVIDARYAGVRPSGIGRYTEALLRHVDVPLRAWLHPRTCRQLASATVEPIPVAARPNHLPTLWWPERLGRLADADVFHAPFNVVARRLPCPTIVTVHDLMWLLEPRMCQSGRLRRWVQAAFFRAGLRNALVTAQRIIAPSAATADAIDSLHPPAGARTVVIPHGVEPHFRPLREEAEATGHLALLGIDRPFALVVGQNAPYKNHRAAIAAFEASVLAADGLLVVVERLGRRRRRRRGSVLYLGGVSEAQLLALLQSTRLFVQFSLAEGFGLPVLEAMACGAPVLVSDIPALRELTDHAAVHVPLDLAALTKAMEALWRDDAWRGDLAALGPARAARFSWATSARAHAELYRVVSGRTLPLRRRPPRLAPRATPSSEHPAPP